MYLSAIFQELERAATEIDITEKTMLLLSVYYPWTSLLLICIYKISIKIISILKIDAGLANFPRDLIVVPYSLMPMTIVPYSYHIGREVLFHSVVQVQSLCLFLEKQLCLYLDWAAPLTCLVPEGNTVQKIQLKTNQGNLTGLWTPSQLKPQRSPAVCIPEFK